MCVLCRNAEDIRREEMDAHTTSASGLNYDGESYTATGKLLEYNQGNTYGSDFEDPTSVCSCTCLGGASCANHELLLDPGYHPAEIVTSTLSLKRASV